MTEHKLKTQPWSYGAVVLGKQQIQARLGDRDFQIGDKVILEEWDPRTKGYTGASATVILTHADSINPFDYYTEKQMKSSGLVHIGLSRPGEAVLVPSTGMTQLKADEETFIRIGKGARVDTRLADKLFKHGGAILYQEIDEDKTYTGQAMVRCIKRVTPFTPFEFYTPKQVHMHGLSVLGWHGIENIIEAEV